MKQTKRLKPGTKIAIQSTKGKGRGVFATARIRAGEVIEAAPGLLIPKAQQETFVQSFLGHYLFQSDDEKHYVIGLGLTSMINHDDHANAEFYVALDRITIKALRTIPSGAEVTVDYGWEPEEWELLGIKAPLQNKRR